MFFLSTFEYLGISQAPCYVSEKCTNNTLRIRNTLEKRRWTLVDVLFGVLEFKDPCKNQEEFCLAQ